MTGKIKKRPAIFESWDENPSLGTDGVWGIEAEEEEETQGLLCGVAEWKHGDVERGRMGNGEMEINCLDGVKLREKKNFNFCPFTETSTVIMLPVSIIILLSSVFDRFFFS